MRFIATADWQLGMTAHFLDDDARPRFHQGRFDAVRRICELAAERGAAFVVVCGDVFESNQLDRSVVARMFEALRSCSVPVVLLPGNHDPLDAASIYDSPVFVDNVPDHVHVLRDSLPFKVTPTVEIVGAPWFSKRPLTDLVADACDLLEPTPPGRVRVIAAHGAVSSLNPDRDAAAEINETELRKVLEEGMAQIAVLGDRHATYEVDPRIWYSGTPEVTARRENDPGNVLVIDVDEATGAVAVEKVHVGAWTFVTVEEQLNSANDVESFRKRLAGMPDKDRTAVWLALSGTLSTGAKAQLDTVLEEAADLFARLDFWDRFTDLAVIPDDHDFEDLGLSGFAEKALEELIDLSKNGNTVAEDSLGLLYRFVAAAR
jgi:DNA repair exonuclease SbcCD nuclease subunit